MTRSVAIIICFMAALFLVPVQSECSEICEYEPETEVECYAISDSRTQPEVSQSSPKQIVGINVCTAFLPVVIIAPRCIDVKSTPARILHCVFRE